MCWFSACKTADVVRQDAPKPPEQYNAPAVQELIASTLSIPVNISVDEVVRKLNAQLSSAALYEDYSYTDNGNDGLMMNVWKSRDLTVNLSGNTVKYRVPLKLWMKKSLVVGDAEAEGELALGFKTRYEINADWTLSTRTEVEYHEWLAKPVLKTGLGNINIESLANIVLNRSKKTLVAELDKIVATQLSLRPYVEEVWKAIQEPTLLSEEYKMWVKTTPQSIGMTPLATDFRSIKAKITVECLNDVSFGDKPVFRENAALPNLRLLTEAPDDFQLRFVTDVPYSEAERLAKNSMTGYVMESGKRKVRVEDIQLWGNGNRLVINTKLSGSFNGNIYFIGRPVFNAAKNQVEVADLDFHLDTRNFLFRSASWLFQGSIARQMRQSMVFPLHENLATLKSSVQETLNRYEIQPGVVLTGALDTVGVEAVNLTTAGIRVDLLSKGRVKVDVEGL